MFITIDRITLELKEAPIPGQAPAVLIFRDPHHTREVPLHYLEELVDLGHLCELGIRKLRESGVSV